MYIEWDQSILPNPEIKLNKTGGIPGFGGKLSDDGILWLCRFSTDSIIGCCLKEKKQKFRISNIPCPIDIAIDLNNQTRIFVGAGCSSSLGNTKIAGQIFFFDTSKISSAFEGGKKFKSDDIIEIEAEIVFRSYADFGSNSISEITGLHFLHNKLVVSTLIEVVVIEQFILPWISSDESKLTDVAKTGNKRNKISSFCLLFYLRMSFFLLH